MPEQVTVLASNPISVNDELPASQHLVLGFADNEWAFAVWIAGGEITTGEEDELTLPEGWYSPGLVDMGDYGYFKALDVTHWLPLPPAPTS